MSDCLFCKIVEKQIPASVTYEDDQCIAFDDISPQAPVHILIVPKVHLDDQRGIQSDSKELMGHLVTVANMVAAEKGLSAFRTVVNTGAEAGQSVFHLHLHLLGGRPMEWPPG